MKFRSAAILAILLTAATARAESLTLARAWDLALDNDPGLQAAREILPESLGNKMSAQAAFLPQIAGEGKIRHYMKTFGWTMQPIPQIGLNVATPFPATDNTVPSYAIGLEQMIFDSGYSIARFRSAREDVNAAEHTVFAHTQGRAVELVRVYSDYYLASKRLTVAKQASRAWNEHERIARLRYRQNMVAMNDVLAAEVEAADARLRVREASDWVDMNAEHLASIIGERPGVVAEPSVPAPPTDIPEPETRAEVMAKEAQSESARLKAQAEGLAYLPRFYGRAEFSYNDDSFLLNKDQYTFIGGVRVPLFDGFRHWGQRKAAKARQARYRYEREALIKAYAVERDDLLRAWRRSSEEVRVASRNRARTAENLRIVRERYANGMVPALDVRDAIALWTQAAVRYHEARCARQLTAARLRQVAGVPVFETGGEDVR
jgi:outer membrane protein